MKKIYIEPKTELTNVRLCNMIAVSTPISGDEATKTGDYYDDSRRRRDLWEDEWDDDF